LVDRSQKIVQRGEAKPRTQKNSRSWGSFIAAKKNREKHKKPKTNTHDEGRFDLGKGAVGIQDVKEILGGAL